MDKKDQIIEKIKKLPDDLLDDLDAHINRLSRKQINTSTGKQLKKIMHKNKIENSDVRQLSLNLKREWDAVKQNHVLTNYIMDLISEIKNPKSDTFMAKRIKSDSRTGGFFEDHFGLILNSFLRSKADLLDEDNHFKLEITLNNPISVPGERNKKQPDILIKNYKTKKPLCIIELKASYTKRSLIREYNTQSNFWKKLDEDIVFLYVIFSCSSKNKAKTYKKVDNCRIVCYDFKTDKDSQIKGIEPKIIDSIELILDEIYTIITNSGI